MSDPVPGGPGGRPPESYLLVPELGDPQGPAASLVERWLGAEDHLDGQRALDQGRMGWLEANGGWFSLGADEVAAYARGLVLLTRWERMVAEYNR